MLTFGRIWSFGLIVVTFVFLPSENWDFWFLGGKEDYYAEFCLRDDKNCYIIAKNLLSKEVRLGFGNIRKGWSQRIDASGIVAITGTNTVPPESYSLLEIDPAAFSSSVRHVTGEGEFLAAKSLVLITPVEEQKWFVFVLALLAAAAALTYSLVSYVREDDRQKAESKVSYSWHSQG